MKNNQENKKAQTIDGIINDALINLKQIIDVNTVIGKEMKTEDGTIIIPISKIIVGFVAGGGELETGKTVKECHPFAGGSGAGFTVVPIGFLTGKEGNMMFVPTRSEAKYDELINLANKTLKLIVDNFKK